jgi:hypothetical protein
VRQIIGLVGIVGSILVVSGAGTWAQVQSYCSPSQTPQARFGFGFAALRDRLGAAMGEPVECEHTNPETGDVLQATTTGVAYQRKGTNTPAFTDGHASWALTWQGLVSTSGVAQDPSPAQPSTGLAPSQELDGELQPRPESQAER